MLQVARFHFYPRSPCGERLYRPAKPAPPRDFYPRSPCGERRLHNAGQDGLCHISIHALLAESDSSSPSGSGRLWVFLSTLSLRRATKQRSKIRRPLLYFYPRSPCGERPTRPRPAAAPRKFLSTLSLRRATDANHCNVWLSNISIHALLAESDRPAKWLDIHRVHISIHALLAESDTRKAP